MGRRRKSGDHPQEDFAKSGFVCSQSGYHPWEDVEKVAIIPRKISPNLVGIFV
jgi:hypothetical protein